MFLGYELFVKKVYFLMFVSIDMLVVVKFLLKMMGQKCLGFIDRMLNASTQYNGVNCFNVAPTGVNGVKQSKCLKASTCHLYFR